MKTRFLISEVNGVTTLKVSETGPAPPVYMNVLARRLCFHYQLGCLSQNARAVRRIVLISLQPVPDWLSPVTAQPSGVSTFAVT